MHLRVYPYNPNNNHIKYDKKKIKAFFENVLKKLKFFNQKNKYNIIQATR
jgi:hypothetical protein